MTDKLDLVRKSEKVEILNITKQDAEGYLKAALDDDLLFISSHARDEMADDNINEIQIRAVLKQNRMVEEPIRDAYGRWSCKFEGRHSGQGIGIPVGFDTRVDGTIVVIITAFTLNNYR